VDRLAIHAVGGELRQFEEGRAGIEQPHDAVARQQLAAGDVALARFLVAAERGLGALRLQVGDDRACQASALARASGVAALKDDFRMAKASRLRRGAAGRLG
jgi:hypothetical protein